mgnify:CR=1 FL=1
MDIRFMQEQLPLYTEAAKITIYIALIGIVCSILLGMICSIVRYFRIPVLSWIVSCYIELSRNTPLLIQLFFLRTSESGNSLEFRSLCDHRTDLPGGKLHGGSIPERT